MRGEVTCLRIEKKLMCIEELVSNLHKIIHKEFSPHTYATYLNVDVTNTSRKGRLLKKGRYICGKSTLALGRKKRTPTNATIT